MSTLSRATGGAITASTSGGIAKYTRIGRQVTVACTLSIDSVTSQGSGDNYISGIPFNPADNFLTAGTVFRNTVFTTDVVVSCAVWSDGKIYFHNAVNTLSNTAVNWQAGYLVFSVTYFV